MAALSAYVHQAIQAISTDPKAAAAAFTGGATAYAGATALDYNKDNFTIDQGNRFGRFTAARGNMMAQVGQYRFDIRGLTNVTVTKCHVFLDTAQLFMCTSAALTCAGRIGMHGSAPPGWLCALYTGNIFLGAMYLTICMWLGFHATLRAQCGMVSLLTRKVRLPVPSLSMINNARVFGSSYEKQRWWDILRFPFVAHPFDAPEIPGESSSEEDADADGAPKNGKPGAKKSKAKQGAKQEGGGDYAASTAYGSTGRSTVPSWIRDEQITDKGNAGVPHHEPQFAGDLKLNNTADPHDAPDHFKLFTEAQKEWFPYETYHKIAMLYGACCFFHAICYYCIITAMSELRGFWIAWAIPGVFMTAQYWILQMDIFKAHGQQFLKGFELFGHIAPYFATAACTCEYRFMYSKAQVGIAWAFAMMSLGSHMLFACRFFDLMTPDVMSKEMEDEDGKSWWPKSWPVPLAFANTLWQLAPPKKLKKGQHCLLHEAMNLESQNGGMGKVRQRFGKEKKRTKRGMPQSASALRKHVEELDQRFRTVQQYVVGKDQLSFQTLHGRLLSQTVEADRLIGSGPSSGSSSGSGSDTGSGSDGYDNYIHNTAGGLSRKAFSEKLSEVAEELNGIEDQLAVLEQNNQVARDGATLNFDDVSGTSTRGLPETPYWIMRAATGTHIFVWAFIMCCTTAEIVMGTTSLWSPPGEPPWIRNTKMRPYQPDKSYLHLSTDPLPSWYRLFVAAEMPPDTGAHGDSHGSHDSHSGHRRLESGAVFDDLFNSLPALDWLAEKYLNDNGHEGSQAAAAAAEVSKQIEGMPTTMAEVMPSALKMATVSKPGFMTPSLHSLPVEWPPLFEPRHLACQTRATGMAMAALTSRGFGALLHMKNDSDITGDRMAAQQFALSGISTHGPLVGASWGTSGLQLVTRAGRILQCLGHAPTDGVWPCQEETGTLVPMSPGAMLRAGTITDHATMGRMAALLFDDMPKTVVLYKEDVSSRAWRPAGEMHLPPGSRGASLGFNGDMLMLVGEDGAVHHRPLTEGVLPSLTPAPNSLVSREWHSACAASGGADGIVRLALRKDDPHPATSWRPELVTTARMAVSSVPLVNV
jgi:hypothetical protein